MKEELFNNETKRKAGQQGREESQHPVYQRQPRQLGLYDAENEHDACGVGMLVNIHGGKSHELVESALKVLENMRHRGAEGADNKTGDGAGILLQAGDSAAQGVGCGNQGNQALENANQRDPRDGTVHQRVGQVRQMAGEPLQNFIKHGQALLWVVSLLLYHEKAVSVNVQIVNLALRNL